MSPTLHLRNGLGQNAAGPANNQPVRQALGYDRAAQRELRECDISDHADNRVFVEGYLDVPARLYEGGHSAWLQHVGPSRQEAGCQKYEFWHDSDIKGRIWISEIYDDANAFEVHKARAGASAWGEAGKDVPRKIDVLTQVPD